MTLLRNRIRKNPKALAGSESEKNSDSEFDTLDFDPYNVYY
jgi:hypothetical protein